MKFKKISVYFLIICLLVLNTSSIFAIEKIEQLKLDYAQKYRDNIPKEWGENVTGVRNRIDTDKKIIALTFDACGQGGLSNGYDKELIDFLVSEEIPATLFISSRWIDINKEILVDLSANPLFTIENHGFRHKPLSLNGNSAYGVKGTSSIEEVVEEIYLNTIKIEELTGRRPKYFRSGTTYYDDVAVMIANDLGQEVINYNVLGDAGATFRKEQIVKSAITATPGSIFLYHMNRPESQVYEGVKEAITILREKGYEFVKLEDFHDQLGPRTMEELRRDTIKDLLQDRINEFRLKKYKIFKNLLLKLKGVIDE
ncbi:polysaccharide deacetylase family protein [Serpentinicella alkaliphila]|uniref:Peptidoglycan/xylan/chitin deacetylase (PgdA/CDA1 family) n=1 Tax=Serpentinicella alkaliphila TaxID=1734049 RepID=A0A4R2T3T6_9FIRM|nr:polysaccharide deacetylase family protein [Serpentinicella alkaliphila]QUH26508.1 polysaccharide deacetylase family protein [Serpentinicella alkaliphila]TCP95494.1 peptidoglycan/xylan/chitin deacetylase (PgdA/CDA1 family) [Serpentinicella alkaliphila]